MERAFVQKLPGHVTGIGAVLLSLGVCMNYKADPSIVVASVFLLIACLTDTFTSRIPNSLNLGMIAVGITLNTAHAGWGGAVQSLLGLVLGIALLLLPYMMGGFGAGDVKALGALGALTGPMALLHIFVYMALCGGILAVLHLMFNRSLVERVRTGWNSLKAVMLTRDPTQMKPDRTEPLRFPYAAAIACGYYSYLAFGELQLML